MCSETILSMADSEKTHAPTETTPGVYQASGYADIAEDKSIWYVSVRAGVLVGLHPTVLIGSGSLPPATIRTTSRWLRGSTVA